MLSSPSLPFPSIAVEDEPTDNPSIVRTCHALAGRHGAHGLLRVVRAGRARIGHWTGQVASRWPGGEPAGRRLARAGRGRVAGQDPVQLGAGADPELGEHLAQVPLDRAGADEQLGADLRSWTGRSRASRAICASWAVSSSSVLTVRLRTVSPVASSSRRARSANPSMPIAAVHLVGGAQLLAGVHAPPSPAQPLAVEQVGAGERHPDAGAAEPLDRLAVEALGAVAARSAALVSAPRPPAPSPCRWRG